MLSRPDDRSLLPGKVTDPGRTGVDKRKTLEGILWVLRPGALAPWRPGETFLRTSRSGTRSLSGSAGGGRRGGIAEQLVAAPARSGGSLS